MKEKLAPAIILLVCTGLLFISGLFLIELQTARQISEYDSQLDSYIQQVEAKKEELKAASCSYTDAIQSQTDLLNWKKQQITGSRQAVDERLPESDSSAKQTSIFSQNTSPEYNSFTSGEHNTSDRQEFADNAETSSQQSSDEFSGNEPAA